MILVIKTARPHIHQYTHHDLNIKSPSDKYIRPQAKTYGNVTAG